MAPSAEGDAELAGTLIKALASRAKPIDRVFFDWRGGRDPGPGLYPRPEFRELAVLLKSREAPRTHPYWSDQEPCSMHIDEVEAIWSAIAEVDDWQPFNHKRDLTALKSLRVRPRFL